MHSLCIAAIMFGPFKNMFKSLSSRTCMCVFQFAVVNEKRNDLCASPTKLFATECCVHNFLVSLFLSLLLPLFLQHSVWIYCAEHKLSSLAKTQTCTRFLFQILPFFFPFFRFLTVVSRFQFMSRVNMFPSASCLAILFYFSSGLSFVWSFNFFFMPFRNYHFPCCKINVFSLQIFSFFFGFCRFLADGAVHVDSPHVVYSSDSFTFSVHLGIFTDAQHSGSSLVETNECFVLFEMLYCVHKSHCLSSTAMAWYDEIMKRPTTRHDKNQHGFHSLFLCGIHMSSCFSFTTFCRTLVLPSCHSPNQLFRVGWFSLFLVKSDNNQKWALVCRASITVVCSDFQWYSIALSETRR